MTLTALRDAPSGVSTPGYDPVSHGCGIVHFGVGAFHRAHQAVYTDDALAKDGGDWRITGVSLRSADAADALNPQDGLYTLIERGADKTDVRVIGSLAKVIAAPRDRAAPLAVLAAPAARVVTLTVTEKAYGIDRSRPGVDAVHTAVAADLKNPRSPEGVLGLITEGLRLRRAQGLAPFTVLCCDNLPDNGALLRAGVIDFAGRTDPDLAAWIDAEAAFPSSMVDCITPAPSDQTRDDARTASGFVDMGAAECEPFRQWVIEDRFTAGRPAWEAGGALFVDDVKPYELMKLRMLNGAHSMLAYTGFLSGCEYVRDVMKQPALSVLVARHMDAAAAGLTPLGKIDFNCYKNDLLNRFSNPVIAHQTKQIAMDGTEKLPQRIFAPAQETLKNGGDARPFAFAAAAWMRYCLGKTDNGVAYPLNDPREEEIHAALGSARTAEGVSAALHRLPRFFPEALSRDSSWRGLVEETLRIMLEAGTAQAVEQEAQRRA
ncbi:MAG: mannitol dehydrogenase family protein [Rhodospirillales bacterium]